MGAFVLKKEIKKSEKNNSIKKIKGKNNAFDTMLNVFAWLSFFLAVILAIAVFLSSFSGTDNGRSIFGYKMLIVESDSMSKSELSKDEPIFFDKDDLIFIKKINDVKEIKVGDVITFVSYNPESKGKTISHKVRSIKTTAKGEVLGFETYGIYTGVSDQAIVDPSTIIGVYVGKSATLGHLFCYFKTPAGYFTSILIPCVLLIIFFSIKVGKILTKREMHRIYYDEFESLRKRLSELENSGGVIMQTDLQTMENTSVLGEELKQEGDGKESNSGEQTMVNVQPIIQATGSNDKVLEIMASTLSKAVDSLTRTIDNLAASVGKPVDLLTRSIETLVMSTNKSTVVEKIVEKPVIQTVIKEVPVEVIKHPVIEEVVATAEHAQAQEPITQEKPIEEAVIQAIKQDVATTGDMFDGFNQREKVAFSKKLLSLDKEVKEYFSDIHNKLVSFKKVSYRVSFKGITYRVGRKVIAKVVVRGKTLKLHLALDVNAYSKTIFFQQDMSGVKAYEDVPFAVKIKSDRAKNNALKLVDNLAENNLLIKDEKFVEENILKQLKQHR